jgi:hypothetical protein
MPTGSSRALCSTARPACGEACCCVCAVCDWGCCCCVRTKGDCWSLLPAALLLLAIALVRLAVSETFVPPALPLPMTLLNVIPDLGPRFAAYRANWRGDQT